jgi:hypothetical protein
MRAKRQKSGVASVSCTAKSILKDCNYSPCLAILSEDDQRIVLAWMQEESKFAVRMTNIPNCYMLLHQTDYDPIGRSKYRTVIDYIHTFESVRRQGVAYGLLRSREASKLDLAAFAANDESYSLLDKAGFVDENDDETDLAIPIMIRDRTEHAHAIVPQSDKRTANHLQQTFEHATRLHKQAVESAGGMIQIRGPMEWLTNENKMREAYDKLACMNKQFAAMLHMTSCNEPFQDAHFAYMKFMCDAFPSGFGNRIMASYMDGDAFDGAKTFLELGGGVQ